MAANGPRKRLALDTNLLFALDALILAETSVAEIPLLVTSDKHLLDIDEDALVLLFNEADLPPVRIAHPRRLLRALG